LTLSLGARSPWRPVGFDLGVGCYVTVLLSYGRRVSVDRNACIAAGDNGEDAVVGRVRRLSNWQRRSSARYITLIVFTTASHYKQRRDARNVTGRPSSGQCMVDVCIQSIYRVFCIASKCSIIPSVLSASKRLKCHRFFFEITDSLVFQIRYVKSSETATESPHTCCETFGISEHYYASSYIENDTSRGHRYAVAEFDDTYHTHTVFKCVRF